MFNLLVAVERSLEASFALRTACFLGTQVQIQPIYIIDPPGRDLSVGTGWARKSWDRENRRQAEVLLEDLLLAERDQCANIRDPVILAGDPIQEITGHFWQNHHDLLLIGTPFRDIGPLDMARQMAHAAQKARRELPLLVVRHLKRIREVVALTDGSAPAESALGILTRLGSYLPFTLTLVGLPSTSSSESQTLILERGQAILKEKGIDSPSVSLADLPDEKLIQRLKAADLVVSPFPPVGDHSHLYGLSNHEIQAVLFYLGVPSEAA